MGSSYFGRVPSDAASGKFHEFVPVMSLLATAAPVFLEVVEHCLSLVVFASVLVVVLIKVVLSAALIDASELSFLSHEFLLVLLWLARFLELLLFFQLCIHLALPLLY